MVDLDPEAWNPERAAMSEQEPLIRIQDLRRDFPMGQETVHALDGVSLAVAAGEFLGVMGLGGLDRPTGGHIWVRDQDLAALDENALAAHRRQEVGFVFQSFHLIPTMTALENVEFPMLFARVPPRQRRQRARRLSGGQQQRVAIARALVNDPTIILADEPTGNVDSHTGAEVMHVLARLCQEQGRTIVVVSHDPAVVDFAGRCIHLLDGRITDANGK
jgi:putative ABC transport system ATP-binding protein